ncbi:DUF7660 family protein [Tenacibaculum maritimum]|uniref:DUF7660 family protein n=2 Tax=Tenacibaculum maritimum TaxID=107401 RepID=UPI00040349B2|nr:hypothetical protein [Tenacibaculum maritimum]MCD9564223.1 hypothetical protein [Tenacibaculum maritimum]MCD9567052.1 hypothetical protein [Tenacibaculum maritimum]MCD9580272.1 hypothetical protein [Tenacibaculum maritimum]MCD9585869.1 hypothetical protein [Tenacibaculum maritimum]MCD9585875.1 hypothetical protein [Tenacibaculum maritimum]
MIDIKEINKIEKKEDFTNFISLLIKSYDNSSNWENKNLKDYLEGLGSWIEDMDGFFENMNIDKPENINWKFIAMALSAATVYE